MRFGWRPPQLPTTCVCGKPFGVDHALICPTGGFPTLRHNELRDLTAKLMKEVCHNVCREPPLQPLSGESLTYPRLVLMVPDLMLLPMSFGEFLVRGLFLMLK